MKTKILMVCLGNICRSPLAEGILASKLDKNLYNVHSCGTSNYHVGNLPDERSIEIARKYGIDLTNQRAAQFTITDFDTYDYIFAMDQSNKENLYKLARSNQDKQKIRLIMDMIFLNERVDIPDPYYGGKTGFENVFKMLEEASNKIATELKNGPLKIFESN
ncbi:low molecular weight protein-tyrosine-phosphatase [Aquimarina sp. W85]|uniref:low molecular weight protein-tyrosine-phosphatase n=1 Tax=Aquimarina rhodophyticola TaxID=3342246 RepID=UPI00366AAB33